MLNNWIAISWEAARLGWEAQTVIMLRMMKLAMGGAPSRVEAHRMVQEKIAAVGEAVTAAASAAARAGRNGSDQTSVGYRGDPIDPSRDPCRP